MRKHLTILTLFLISCIISTAQDLNFSQFYEQPLLRNPALSGLFKGDLRVSGAFRDQWGSITVPFRTTSMSMEYKMQANSAEDVITIGTQLAVDAAGDIRLKRTSFLPSLNFHKSLSGERNEYLSLAFMGGLVSSQFDASKMKLGDQFRNGSYDPSNPTAQQVVAGGYQYWDAAAGLCYSNSLNNGGNFYVAAGIHHFTRPKISSTTTNNEVSFLYPRLTANIGINTPISDQARITLFADYYKQGANQQILGGAMFGLDLSREGDEPYAIYAGSFLRVGDALIPMLKMDMQAVSIGLSYDVNISRLKVASNWRGGFELSMVYKGFLKIRNSTIDMTRCVSFGK